MTVLKVSNLQHTYPNGVIAVNNVNVEIKQGEQVSVVGQNGSGKTTLVKHWNGLLKPTEGNVYVGELDTLEHSVNVLARKVGYVFQNPNHQIFAASVRDELEFGLINIGLDEDEIKNSLLAEGADPLTISKNLAEIKSIKVSSNNPDKLVLGADSVISLENKLNPCVEKTPVNIPNLIISLLFSCFSFSISQYSSNSYIGFYKYHAVHL